VVVGSHGASVLAPHNSPFVIHQRQPAERSLLLASMGKPILEEIQWIIVRLSTTMSREDIAMYTGVSERKVDDVLSTFNRDGTVKVYTRQTSHTYRSLCDEDVQVSSFCLYTQQLLKLATQHLFQTLEATPDLFLDELCQDLELQTGKSVSISTIWRTLRRAGYTMKKVHHNKLYCHCIPEGGSVILVAHTCCHGTECSNSCRVYCSHWRL
jgi:transposase